MSSLSELPELVGFFSYSRSDDQHSGGALSRLRARIHDELRLQLGRDVRLWQDTAAIPDGSLWADEIKRAVAEAAFFIPIVTPSAVGSPHCKHEFDSFLKREEALGRHNLVFPIVYIRVPGLEDERQRRENELLRIICARQYVDWQKLRLRDWASVDVAERIEQFCRNIVDAMRQPWLPPEERQRREQAEGRRRGEGQRPQEEELRTRAEAEARQRVEEERRQEAEAKRSAEQEQAFVAAKRADAIDAVDAFLANHPESRHAAEARTLRMALMARDEPSKAALASDDAAVLKASLEAYPMGSTAEQVRGRLRSFQPQSARWPSRQLVVAVVFIALALFGIGSLMIYIQNRDIKNRRVPADDLAICTSDSGDDAIAACSRAINSGKVSPTNLASVLRSRGSEYAAKKNYDLAIADFNEAIKLDPNGSSSFVSRGRAYDDKNDYDRAIADFSEAIKLDPNDSYSFFWLGAAYHDKKDYNRAIANFDEAIKLNPNNAAALFVRGLAKQSNGDSAGGTADVAAAKKIDPTIGN